MIEGIVQCSCRRAARRCSESLRLLTLLIALVFLSSWASGADDLDIRVKVNMDGEVVRVESSYLVAASPQDVWAVMIDFEHMPRFISNLRSSAVVATNGDKVTIAQSGEASLGIFKFAFESVRELRLTPFTRIESRMIRGNNLSRYQGTTDLVAEGLATRVTVRSEAVPDKWVPPLLGPRLIAQEAREQLTEFRAEILRRKAASGLAERADPGRAP
jgi:uncharacterized membrane protein